MKQAILLPEPGIMQMITHEPEKGHIAYSSKS